LRALEQRHAGAKIARVAVPVRGGGLGRRDVRGCALDDGVYHSDGPEVRMARQPRVPGHTVTLCGTTRSLGSTGISRATSPNRKMVAAIRPIDTPHSTIDGT